MHLKEKRIIATHELERAPVCEFVTYLHSDQPILLRRMGWVVGNDVHDEITDSFSTDNGQSWSAPRLSYQSRAVEGGFLVHTESAVLLHKQRNLLVTITNEKFESSLSECDLSLPNKLRVQYYSTHGEEPGFEEITTPESPVYISGLNDHSCVSFSSPILDSRGRILVPVQSQRRDATGEIARQGFDTVRDHPDILQDVWQSSLLVGEFATDGSNSISWRVGAAVPYEFADTSRGLFEGTVAELSSGALAMISRGSNAAWPAKPGYKWLSFSHDGGESWTQVEPLSFDDESTPQSSSTGSLLFRSHQNDKLYWIGNLCANGERADGNFPRSPLYICEVQEDPFRLRKSTLFRIDERAPHEDSYVQLSNFRTYQDRVTGEIVIYLTRYGERGSDEQDWIKADLYQYRVSLEKA